MLGIAPGDEIIFEVMDREARIKPAGARSSVTEETGDRSEKR